MTWPRRRSGVVRSFRVPQRFRHISAISRRRSRPSCCCLWPSKERGRREGRVPTAPMVRVQQKARGRTTGTGGSSGLPCAMVLRLIRALPGDHSLVATVASQIVSARLSACVGAPGPHDFAVRTNAARRAIIALGDVRPSHPVPNVRDDREPPLFSGTRQAG